MENPQSPHPVKRGMIVVVVQPITHEVFGSGVENSRMLTLTELMLDLGEVIASDDSPFTPLAKSDH